MLERRASVHRISVKFYGKRARLAAQQRIALPKPSSPGVRPPAALHSPRVSPAASRPVDAILATAGHSRAGSSTTRSGDYRRRATKPSELRAMQQTNDRNATAGGTIPASEHFDLRHDRTVRPGKALVGRR